MKEKYDYVLRNFQMFYQINDIKIGYGQNNDKVGVRITQNVDDSFFKKKKDLDLNGIVWKEWKGIKIPFCFANNDNKKIISQDKDEIVINYDIVASSFYFLSGWDEYVNSQKDEFGRVTYENSIIKKLNIISLPIVNYYFDILHHAISWGNGKLKKNLWDNHDFGVVLTHDIDTCTSAWIEGSFSELKKKRLFSIPKLILKRLFAKDDWFNFQKISEIEKQFGATSSFYFLAQKGKSGKWKNADYNVTSKDIQKEIFILNEQGHEVGIHGSFGTHKNVYKLRNDIDKINSNPIVGNRFHFLMFDPEKSVGVLEASKIKYDTSLGFAEHIGFRRGTCFPFYLFDFNKNQCSEVLELPLIVMDVSMRNTEYMGISQERALETIFELIDEIRKFNGIFTILWHNTYFSDYKYTGWKDIYIKVLKYCGNHNALITNGKKIYEKVTGQ